MKQISVENIEKALKKVDSLQEEELDQLIEGLTLQQQPLVDYLLQAGVEFENEELNVYSIYYFAVVVQAIQLQGFQLKPIKEEDIDAFHDPFLLALDAIHSNEDYEPLQDLIQQPNLEQFILDEIESPDSDGVILEEEIQTQLFIVTISMIGLLNEAIDTSA
ncbi:MAG: hypothetical protein WDZ35_13065 [Crocinitomicaceae bacterium]